MMADAVRESSGKTNLDSSSFANYLLDLPSSFNFQQTQDLGVHVSNIYQKYSDGSWTNLTNPNTILLSAGQTTKSMYDQLGASLWHDVVEKGWDEILDKFGTAGQAIKDATNVGKIVSNYFSNLVGILDESLKGFDPAVAIGPASAQDIISRTNENTKEFLDDTKDYLKDKFNGQSLYEQLRDLLMKQSIGVDPLAAATTKFFVNSYTTDISTINYKINVDSYYLGSGKNIFVAGYTGVTVTAIGAHHNESVSLNGNLAEFNFISNLNLGADGHEIYDPANKNTVYTFHVDRIYFFRWRHCQTFRQPDGRRGILRTKKS
ncbi:hypothetical protein [Methylobacterium sp. J-076]|uniref:hypothetical protein n=1 Tax=Methylobacterium sp. J-076 TaxID=2836655 RepID=UPI001FBA04EE|nr:hypothetical protein [Methylobacterium sp. J-076]MCJ2012159.1 hypothetical protein [Methylobacterium sp. J-076]